MWRIPKTVSRARCDSSRTGSRGVRHGVASGDSLRRLQEPEGFARGRHLPRVVEYAHPRQLPSVYLNRIKRTRRASVGVSFLAVELISTRRRISRRFAFSMATSQNIRTFRPFHFDQRIGSGRFGIAFPRDWTPFDGDSRETCDVSGGRRISRSLATSLCPRGPTADHPFPRVALSSTET